MSATTRKLNTNGRVVSEILTNYRDTFRAFTELINNSIQEGSTEIKINININKNSSTLYPVIDSIELLDNGNGVHISEFDKRVLEIGTTVKPGGHGIGRFSALQIGECMTIETVGQDNSKSKYSKVSVEIKHSALKNKTLTDINFPTDEKVLAKPTNTYYKIIISDLHQNRHRDVPKSNKLSEAFYGDNLPNALAQYYLLEIFNGEIKFFINDKKLERSQFVIGQPVVISRNFETIAGDIFKIEFKFFNVISELRKVKIFTMIDNAGISTVANEYTYSSDYYTPDLGTWFVYIESSMFTYDLFKNALIETFGDEDSYNLRTFIRNVLNDFFKDKNSGFSEFVSKLNKDASNPFNKSKAVSETHQLVFNKIAYLVETKFKVLDREDKIKDLMYSLIDNSIRNGQIEPLFSKLVKMKAPTVEKFHDLMERTEIESVVQFSSDVAKKIEFLDFLHEITYGDLAKVLRERSQLHKIVEKQLWLFGESYAQTTNLWSDKKIGNIFDEIRQQTLAYEPTKEDQNLIVFDKDEYNDITDLFFYNEKLNSDDTKEFMVVELKSPKCKIGQKELNQIDKYAYQIEETTALPSNKTKYKLLLISSEVNAFAKSKMKSAREKYDHPFIYDIKTDKNVEVYVMTWSELIESNKRKLNYLSAKLEVKDKSVGEKFAQEYPELLNDKVNSQLRFIKTKL